MTASWLVIARREFLERVRTKWFAIVTALGPLFMIGIMVVPIVLATMGGHSKILIVDHSGKGVGAAMKLALESPRFGWEVAVRTDAPTDAELSEEIRARTINGFLTLPPDVLDKGRAEYQGDNTTNQVAMITIATATTATLQTIRGTELHLDDKQLAHLLLPAQVHNLPNNGRGTSNATGGTTFILGYIVMIILYMAIVLYAINVMRSVVQEKTNRVVEIMVAAAKPRALMLGKIIGVGAVGLAQLGVWMVMAVVTIVYREPILGLFGLHGGFALPPLAASDAIVILGDFVLGYFFYASLYAAVGAMVSSDQEAQQAQMPVTMILVLTMITMQVVANDPRGAGAEALTLIPFSSPILMPMRWLLGGASALDAALSFAILAASTAGIALLAGRIYRVGILMYGKRPGLRELIRWLRHA